MLSIPQYSRPVLFYSLDIFDLVSQTIVAHEVNELNSVPSRKDQVEAELPKIKSTRTSLMQRIQDWHRRGAPSLAILDELEATREKLPLEFARSHAQAGDFQAKIAAVHDQFGNEETRALAADKLPHFGQPH